MKQKLRKLVHKGQEYLYRVNTAYNTKGDNTFGAYFLKW